VLQAVPVLFYSRHRRARTIYGELLTSWGLAPVLAENSLAALAAVQSASKAGKPFQLVVVDIGASGDDRWSLVEALHRRGLPNEHCQFVLLLTPTRADDRQRCEQLAVRHTLVKPPKHAELRGTLAAALGDPAAARAEPTAAGPARSLRILLAEDSVVNQEVAVGLLKLRGHQVEVANNGLEALERFQQHSFDVVLMDVEMPEMDGLQATMRLRELEHGRARQTPVVAMTAHALRGFHERCAAVGMNAYISKPVNAHELFQTVEAIAESLPVATALGNERGVVLGRVDAEGVLADHADQN
jgi:CheY-like chemotaxis protein